MDHPGSTRPEATSRTEGLLPLAVSRPGEALERARALLTGRPTPWDASVARQAMGIVLRDQGHLSAALAELRQARRLARASGDASRSADVEATLGVALALAGRTGEALTVLDAAASTAASASGPQASQVLGQVLMRRSGILSALGRSAAALDDLAAALRFLRRAGDHVWVARALTHRGHLHLSTGQPGRARDDFARAEEMLTGTNQDLEYAKARHNLGVAAVIGGDVPAGLAYFDEAARRYSALGVVTPELAADRCAALLTAGLARDAMLETQAAVAAMPARGGHSHHRAELTYAAATAALAAGEPGTARDFAQRARQQFLRQGRPSWAARAGLVAVQARLASGERSAALERLALATATALADRPPDEAARARLTAGQVLLARGRKPAAVGQFALAASARRRGTALARAAGWLARALQAEADGDGRGVLLACDRGLAAVEQHQTLFGDLELRARATAHGADLAAIALREAQRRADARLLLRIGERWRATTVSAPPAPADDPDLLTDLLALRATSRQFVVKGNSRSGLLRERRRRQLEESIRARSHLQRRATPPGSASPAGRFQIPALLTALATLGGGATLLDLMDVDGALHVVTACGRRVRAHPVGPVPGPELEPARAALRRAALGGGDLPGGARLLPALGERLERLLLGPAAADLAPGPVVLVPPGRLHTVPWALLPALRDRELSVAPSAAAWLRAAGTPPPQDGRVVLVTGPALDTAGAEVPLLAGQYPGAIQLSGASATVEAVLAALDGARLAHIAAHGTFRADNPLFSALHLHDGPLTVHDLHRLRRPPDRLVLSSCESGMGAAVGADELLGLAASLIAMGAGGVLGAIGPVSDDAVVPLMLAVHESLADGAGLAAALLAGRQRTAGTALGVATGASFLAMGR